MNHLYSWLHIAITDLFSKIYRREHFTNVFTYIITVNTKIL